MFQIKIADIDVSTGSVPISWCLDLETLDLFAKNGLTDPQVVIVVSPVDNYHMSKEFRKIAPLKDLIAYVEFNSPGPNKIWAFVSYHTKSEVKDTYLSKFRGGFNTSILDSNGSGFNLFFENALAKSSIDVDVPSGLFATSPSNLESDWVNYLYNYKCSDQCEFRRRRLFAYIIQPFIVLAQQFIRLVITLISLLIGAKNFSIQPLIHPLSISNIDSTEIMFGGSIFIKDPLNDDSYDYKNKYLNWLDKYHLLPLMPAISIPVLCAIIFMPWPILVGIFLGLFLTALVALLTITQELRIMFFEKIFSLFKNNSFLNNEEIALLNCNLESKPLTFNSLPSNKRTIKLRLQDIKSKVCKPFSR